MTLQMPGRSTKRQVNSDQLIQASQPVTAIPYYAWANRGPSEMKSGFPMKPQRRGLKTGAHHRFKPASPLRLDRKQRMYRALNDQ